MYFLFIYVTGIDIWGSLWWKDYLSSGRQQGDIGMRTHELHFRSTLPAQRHNIYDHLQMIVINNNNN